MGILVMILGAIIGVIGICLTDEKVSPFRSTLITFLLMISGGLVALGCASINNDTEPQAIDVYRGKTTLQITYQDSIPVDSIVVFKENVINDN